MMLEPGAGTSESRPSTAWSTPAIATLATVTSVVLLLSLTSPEFSWDEADLLGNTTLDWGALWSGHRYSRHFHGPMGIYLSKLGIDGLPATVLSLEARTRLPIAVVASMAIGLVYWALRSVFKTSQAAALVGTSLLLLSVIRLEETNVIGPHHLMLVCSLALLSLGYRWRDTPSMKTAVGLGCVLSYGALSMTYVIPAALCTAAALTLAGSRWISWDRQLAWRLPRVRISKWLFAALGTTVLGMLVVWPPSLLNFRIGRDFAAFVFTVRHHPTLVGDQIFEATPRWAALHWLLRLDAPVLVASSGIILTAFWRVFRTGRWAARHTYLGVWLLFFLGTGLTAHLAGARNLLQLVGVLCLVTGALFDDAFQGRPRLSRFGAPAIATLALANLARLAWSSSYTPFLATDGYRAFVAEGASRLREKATAVVYGLPVLSFYAQKAGVTPAWTASELPWTTFDYPLPAGTKYVLLPAFIDGYMPANHPTRRIVADHWKVVWSFKGPHVWELRLFEAPAGDALSTDASPTK
jgi:hypothetical protein